MAYPIAGVVTHRLGPAVRWPTALSPLASLRDMSLLTHEVTFLLSEWSPISVGDMEDTTLCSLRGVSYQYAPSGHPPLVDLWCPRNYKANFSEKDQTTPASPSPKNHKLSN